MAGSKQTAPEGPGMQKTLSIWNYFTIGFGAIIGTGWVLLVGDWMIIGGVPELKKQLECLMKKIFMI